MQRKETTDVDILKIVTGDLNMTIHYLDPEASFMEKVIEIFWIAILHIGFPIFSIFEWMHWEIYGHGPRKEATICKKIR
jgi:hypothetical protein